MKKIIGIFAGATLAALLFSCAPAQKNFIIATGGTSGTYYPFGGAIANIWNTKVENMNVTAQATGASAENLRLVSKGDAEFATVQNDVMDYAYYGTDMFDAKLPNILAIGTMYEEVVQIAARVDSGIKTISDLRGKRVSIGDAGSGVEFNAKQILEGYGLTFDDIKKSNLSFKESGEGLQNGTLDACFVTAGVPNAALQELAFTNGLVLIPVDGPEANSICAKYGFYTKTVIPGGTYKGTDSDTAALAIKCTIVVNSKLDEDTVYKMTKALFDNVVELGQAHAKGKEVNAAKAVTGVSIPFHPGAQKYFVEAGALR